MNTPIFTLIMCYLVFCNTEAKAQSYPRWFLETGRVPCQTAVGYEKVSIFPDSAVNRAFEQACLNWVRQKQVTIQGGQAFWSTEIGTVWMGSDFYESFDSSRVSIAQNSMQKLDSLISKNMVAVLVGPKECPLADSLKQSVNLAEIPGPEWIKSLPENSHYVYAIGAATEYFYEASSWLEAEYNARLNLAREVFTRIQSLQKVTTAGEEVRHEETKVVLRNLRIVARWLDLKNKIFYVLIRMPIN